MRRLLLLLAAILLPSVGAQAEEWISDLYNCALNTPPDESWVRGNAVPLQSNPGDLIYSSRHPETKQQVAVVVVPNVLSNSLQNPAVVSRVMECMQKEFGLSIGTSSPVEINGQAFLQVIGRRTEGGGGSSFAVARAALRNNTLYIALTMGRGAEDRSEDKYFTRVLDTFRFFAPAEARQPQFEPYYKWYRLGQMACFAAAGAIAVGFVLVMTFSRSHRT